MSSAPSTAATVSVSAWARPIVYMSTGRAAKLLGLSRRRITQMIDEGKVSVTVDGVEVGPRRVAGGNWQVPAAWVNRERAPQPIRRKPA